MNEVATAVATANPINAEVGRVISAQSTMMMPHVQQMPAQRERLKWSEEEIQIIKNSLVKGAPDTVFKYFLAAASTMNLNPLHKEIFIVPYGDESRGVTWVLQEAVEGKIRHAWESQRFNGFGETTFIVKDKQGVLSEIKMKWFDPDGEYTIVSATVYANIVGRSEPVQATCHFKRYAKRNEKGELKSTWALFPERMIEKCAQAKVLRENFPGHGGVYIPEEMDGIEQPEGFRLDPDGGSPKGLPPKTRQRRLQKPVAPLAQANDDVIDTTATVVEEKREEPAVETQTSESAQTTDVAEETAEAATEETQQDSSVPTEADGDPEVVAYLNKVTDSMTRIYHVPPDGIHHMNRLIRNKFEVDEPWMLAGERLEELQKYCRGQLLKDMEAGEWVPARGSK